MVICLFNFCCDYDYHFRFADAVGIGEFLQRHISFVANAAEKAFTTDSEATLPESSYYKNVVFTVMKTYGINSNN